MLHDLGQRIAFKPALPVRLPCEPFRPPMHVIELGYRVPVGVDAEYAAEVERALVPPPVQIQPPRVSVNLNSDSVLGAARAPFNVNVVACPTQQLPTRHVSKDRRVRVRNCPEQALGLDLSVQLEAAVDTRHHEIEAV